MKRIRTAGVSLSILALVIIQVLTGQSASAQDEDISIVDSVVFIVQGENAMTNITEGVDDFYALRIINCSLPYDSSRVHMNVPQNAQDVLVIASGDIVDSDGYGWENDGTGNYLFYVDVPSTQSRTNYFSDLVANETEFLSDGSVLYNTSYDSGSLHLVDGSADGFYVSGRMPVTDAQSVLSANITLWGDSLENVSIRASNNNGTDWVVCANSTRVNFTGTGTDLLFRFDFIGNASIRNFSVSSEYTRLFFFFDFHVSYIWTQPFVGGVASIELTDLYSYQASASCLLWVYLLEDYNVAGENVTLSISQNGMQSPYPDKTLFINNSYRPDEDSDIVVKIIAPKAQSQLGLYMLLIVIAGTIAGAFAYARFGRKQEAASEEHGDDAEEWESPEESSASDASARRRDLVDRKKALLAEIAAVKKQASQGELGREDAEAKLSAARKEFKSVRNELNKLPKAEEMAGGSSLDTMSTEYEAALAALARIDDDHDKGRLTEESYKKLRTEYMSKATRLAEDVRRGQSADSTEKTKLMEAIVALDEEHDRGDIPDTVYADLKSSYKKQLAEILKKSDESQEE